MQQTTNGDEDDEEDLHLSSRIAYIFSLATGQATIDKETTNHQLTELEQILTQQKSQIASLHKSLTKSQHLLDLKQDYCKGMLKDYAELKIDNQNLENQLKDSIDSYCDAKKKWDEEKKLLYIEIDMLKADLQGEFDKNRILKSQNEEYQRSNIELGLLLTEARELIETNTEETLFEDESFETGLKKRVSWGENTVVFIEDPVVLEEDPETEIEDVKILEEESDTEIDEPPENIKLLATNGIHEEQNIPSPPQEQKFKYQEKAKESIVLPPTNITQDENIKSIDSIMKGTQMYKISSRRKSKKCNVSVNPFSHIITWEHGGKVRAAKIDDVQSRAEAGYFIFHLNGDDMKEVEFKLIDEEEFGAWETGLGLVLKSIARHHQLQ